MKRKLLLSICISMLSLLPVFSVTLEESGHGFTKEEARIDADSNLSSRIEVRVSSELVALEEDDEFHYSSIVKVNSNDIPLLGLEHGYTGSSNGGWTCRAHLDSDVSLPLYQEQLDVLAMGLGQSREELSSIDEISILNGLHSTYSEFMRYLLPYRMLGGVYGNMPQYTLFDLEVEMERVRGRIDSTFKASLYLTQDMSVKGIYVYPPLESGDTVVSDWGMAFRKQLEASLAGRTEPSLVLARHFLVSSYDVLQDGSVKVTSALSDRDGSILNSSSVTVPSVLIDPETIHAEGIGFRKSLENLDPVSGKLKVDVRVNGGNEGILLEDGDEISLEVKANRSCWFYIVGYVFNEYGEEFSYLFPLSFDEEGKDMFVGRISSSERGIWKDISPVFDGELIPLAVIEPYGFETVQVYATTGGYDDILSMIPSWVETEEYYLISDDPEKALSLTRGLSIKKAMDKARNRKEIENVESSVSYRTTSFM